MSLLSLCYYTLFLFFFFNDTATTEIYTLSLHDALPISIAARLAIAADGGGWQVSTDDLEVRRAELSVAASGAIGADGAGGRPQLNAHLALKDADVALLAGLLGPRALAAFGAAAARLTAGP